MNDSIASRFYEKSRIDKLRIKIKMCGINYDPYILMSSKVVLSIIIFSLLLICRCGLFIPAIVAILFYFIIGFLFIDLRIYLRMRRLEKDAVDYIPILLLSMENGRNIKSAIEVSSETINNELSREFKKVLEDVKVGHSLEEALKELGERIPSNYINNMILSLEEANKLGVSATDSINRQLTLINENRVNYEKRILKGIPLHLAILCLLCFTAMVTVLVVFNR